MDRLERLDEAIDRIETVHRRPLPERHDGDCLPADLPPKCLYDGPDLGRLLLRNLVLWIGFIGATLATREGKHINIDVISRSLPPLGRAVVEVCIHLFSCFICGLLTYASLKFVRNEAEMGTTTLLSIPIWILEAILPLTFGLMAFRFALRSIKALSISVERVKTHDRRRDGMILLAILILVASDVFRSPPLHDSRRSCPLSSLLQPHRFFSHDH